MSFNITKKASPQNTARSAMLNEYSCSRVVLPRARESSPPFQSFSPSRQTDSLAALARKTPQVSKRDRSCSASREPLSIDVQAPLYTLLEVTTPPMMVTPIPHTWATRIRRSFLFPPKRSPSSALVPALVLIGLLLAASFATLAVAPSAHDASSVSSAPGRGRNATVGPFSRDSIWNLPIGANAAYVPGNIKKPTASGMTTDVDVLILTPTAPVTKVWENSDAWSGGSRCAAQGGVLFEAPIPTDFVVPGAGSGNPDGTTPNYATAILAADGHTLVQGQPMARCTAGGTATMWWWDHGKEDLFGTGNSGAHGGSMLSSLGGVIRLGELVPGGAIHHALKVNLLGADNYYSGSGGYRWPATTADGCAPGCYGGSVPALRVGSLLALPPSIHRNSMGPGTRGVGGGAPRVPWAPDFGPDSAPPVATVSLSGIRGTASWFVSPVDVTLTATDDSSGVASIHYRTDGGTWQLYRNPITVQGDGFHTIDYYATDLAGNNETARTTSFQIDTVGPVSSAQVSGTLANDGSYLSPVTVTLEATSGSGGAVSIAYRLDGNAWATYANPIVLLDGRHVLEYQATDAQGYSEPAKSAAINVDSTPPSLVANSPSDPLAPDGSISWSGSDSGSGIARYEVAIDGSAFASVGLQTTLTRTWTVGTHVVSVRAYDAAGNMKSAVVQFNVASNPTPGGPPGDPPSTPPGIPEIVVGLLMLGISMWYRPRVKSRRPVPAK